MQAWKYLTSVKIPCRQRGWPKKESNPDKEIHHNLTIILSCSNYIPLRIWKESANRIWWYAADILDTVKILYTTAVLTLKRCQEDQTLSTDPVIIPFKFGKNLPWNCSWDTAQKRKCHTDGVSEANADWPGAKTYLSPHFQWRIILALKMLMGILRPFRLKF